jgi:hypothetical protein
MSMISSFCHDVDEICALLGYYEASNGNPFFSFLFIFDFVTLEDGTNMLS